MTHIPPDIDERLDRLIEEMDAIIAEHNTLKKAEEFHRVCSRITCDDYFREFTI